jgi:hypothetical protein
VADVTPPPPPYDLKLTVKNNRTVELVWKADADIESGILRFDIFQDDRLIAQFPATSEYQRFDTNGDDAFPVSTLLPMKMELSGIVADDDALSLSISTVNHFSLSSEKVKFPL